MTSIQHICAATDLSAPSLQAIDRAFQLARTMGARLTLMQALGLDALGPLRGLLGEQAESVARNALARQREAIQSLAADSTRRRDVDARVHVEEGLPTVAVPAYVSATGADLVVVGARGSGILRRLVTGSTTSRLLRKSSAPVLVVKSPGQEPYRRVLVALDFSPASETTLRLARQLRPAVDLVLLHVFDVPFEGMLRYAGVSPEVVQHYQKEARERALGALHELAARAGLDAADYTAFVERGDAVQHIDSIAKQYRCDLIAMGKHGTHVTEELLLGSVTRRVLAESDQDLLVVVDDRHPDEMPVIADGRAVA